MTTTPTDFNVLLDALDLSELQPEEQEEILLDISDLVFRGSMTRIIERMDDQTKEAFSELLDRDPSEEEITEFIQDRVPGSDEVVKETITDFANDILAVSKK